MIDQSIKGKCKYCINVVWNPEKMRRQCSIEGVHIFVEPCPLWMRATGADDDLENDGGEVQS